jgi:hypothetical protein
MLIGDYMTKEDFIKNSKIIFRTKNETIPNNINYTNNYKSSWINMNNLLNKKYGQEKRNFLSHQATICDKNVIKDLIQQFPNEYKKTCSTKFRNGTNVPPIGFSLHNGVYNKKVILENDDNISNHYFRLNNNMNYMNMNFNTILKNKPKLICLNDQNNFNPSNKHMNLIQDFLEKFYPI